METYVETVNDHINLRFTYNLIPGVTEIENYGIFLARSCWPEIIMKHVDTVLHQVTLKQVIVFLNFCFSLFCLSWS